MPAQRQTPTRCTGSSVPGDYFEHGHEIVPGTEDLMFPLVGGFAGKYQQARCHRCTSHRNAHRSYMDLRPKARHAHASHAKDMVDKGFAVDIATARKLMDGAGVTVEFITDMFTMALGQECPGWCGHIDTDGSYHRHVITEPRDLHFDWQDPRYPLTPENCGPLCHNCNQQKGAMTFPAFMARQRAIVLNMSQRPAPAPPLQLSLLTQS